MTQRRFLRRLFVVALCVASGSLAAPALAQKAKLPPDVKVSRDPKVIVNQIQLAIAEEKKALAGFEAAALDDPLAEARQAAINGYVLIRVARSGVEDIKDMKAKEKKFADPILDLVFQRIDRAWNDARFPVDSYQGPNSGSGRGRYIEESIRRMNAAIAQLEQVLYMWP